MRLLLAVLLVFSFSQAVWGDVETLRAEANAAANEGILDEAAAKFRELLAVAPDDGAAHYRLGSLLMDKDEDLSEAIVHFERAGELDFQPQGVGYRLSRIYARSGQTEQALIQLETIAAASIGNSKAILPEFPEYGTAIHIGSSARSPRNLGYKLSAQDRSIPGDPSG